MSSKKICIKRAKDHLFLQINECIPVFKMNYSCNFLKPFIKKQNNFTHTACLLEIEIFSVSSVFLSLFFLQSIALFRACIQRKTWCMGPYDGVDLNSTYLIVNYVVSYPPPLHMERGGMGKISPI
jgi:hypothetical protein